MSSYLSSEYKIQQPVSPGDINLDMQILSTMQGRYDSNKAKIDQTLAVYNNQLRGLRAEDNEYIANRLNEVDSVIEQYKKKNGNLAYNSTTDTILSTVKSLMDDPIIKDAVKNKAYFDNYEKQVQEIKKKDPKLYNDVNYQYGLYKGGYQAYMKGEAKGLGSLNYTPYNDNAEEHLKKLKTIKDLKGKRFYDEQAYDVDGKPIPGMIKHKEIDGLTASEISDYFEGMMTSEELTQMNINAWGKFAQPNQIEQAKTTLNLLNKAQIEYKEKELLGQKAIADASGDDTKKEAAKANVKILTSQIEALKNVDVSKLNSETIAFELEKTDYLRSLTRMAATEWSTSYEVDEVWKMNQELDLKREDIEIKKAKLALDATKQTKEGKSGAFGENAIVATNTMQGDLSKELAEENKGANLLEAQHNNAYNEINATARDYLKNADDNNKDAFINSLKSRGIGADLQWIDKNKSKEQSLVNTIFSAWESTGIGKVNAVYGDRMLQAYNQKQTAAKDILKVNKEAYLSVFKKDPDKYIESLKKQIYAGMVDGQSDLFEDGAEELLANAKKAQAFVDSNGGWNNLKQEMLKTPNKLSQFAEVLNPLTDRWRQVLVTDLKKDTATKKEELIQKYTSSGSMMSSYNQYNFNQKTNEFIANATSQTGQTYYVGKVLPKDQNNILDPKKPMSVHREGTKNNVQLVVTQAVPGGFMRKTYDKRDEVYSKIESLIDLEAKKSTSIQASKDTRLEPSKVSLFSTTSQPTAAKRLNSAAMVLMNALPPENIVPNAHLFATKESAKDALTTYFTANLKIEPKLAETYTQHIIANAGLYTVKPVVGTNLMETGYEFNLQFKKEGRETPTESKTGVDKLTAQAQNLLRYYPDVVILNDLCNRLKDTNTEEQRATIINNF